MGEDLQEIGGADDGDDTAEDAAALALADEGEGALEVFRRLRGDAADGTIVEGRRGGGGGGGGGEANEGSEHLEDAIDVLPNLGALEFERVGLVHRRANSLRHHNRVRQLVLHSLLLLR